MKGSNRSRGVVCAGFVVAVCALSAAACGGPAGETSEAISSGHAGVAYDWSFQNQGRGPTGGGPLYAGGIAGGVGTFVEQGCMVRFVPSTWTEANQLVDICFDVQVVRSDCPGSSPGSSFCLSDLNGMLPASGGDQSVVIGGTAVVLRVTPTGRR